MLIKTIPISQINPAKYNPRKDLKPGDVEYEKLKKSILAFDMVEPLVYNRRSGNLIGGHQRLKILKELGYKEVEVSVVDLPDNKEKALNLALNKISGDWNYPMLKDLLLELDVGDLDMEITGFDTKEIEDLLTQFHVPGEGLTDDDAIPEKVETICKTGDLWQLGEHRLLCGDSTKKEDVEKLMQGEKADMVFTDPPYSVGIGKKNRALNSVQPSGRCLNDLEGDNQTVEWTSENIWKPAFENMYKFTKDKCSIYITQPQGGDQMMMMMMMMSAFWDVKHELIWIKNQPSFSIGRLDYDYQHEPIIYGWKKGESHNWYGNGQFNKSIWNIDRPRESKLHPTMKPIALMENAILNSSKLNEIILDVFGGSGSTLIACEKLGRKCRMMEIADYYCDVIISRWQNYSGKKAQKIESLIHA